MNTLILSQELQNDYKKIKTEEIKLNGLQHCFDIKDEPSIEYYLEELENGNKEIVKQEVQDDNETSIDDGVVFLEEIEIGNQVIIKEEIEDFEIELNYTHDSVSIDDAATVNDAIFFEESENSNEIQAQMCKQFECRVCNLKFPNELTLRKHSEIHSSGRVSYQDTFSKFLKGHIEEKSFACKKCSYTTSCAELMQRHLRYHNPCDVCGKINGIKCSRTANCRGRITVCDSSARPYACEVCNYRATTPTNLNRHLRMHTPDEQY